MRGTQIVHGFSGASWIQSIAIEFEMPEDQILIEIQQSSDRKGVDTSGRGHIIRKRSNHFMS
jgi:hypothetical protein